MKVSWGWSRVVGGCGALALASMLGGCLPAGGNGSSSSSSCDSDEVRARPSGLPRACYAICETQADCSGATTCSEVNGGNDLACLPEAGAVNNPTLDCTSNAECSGATPVCSGGVCVSEGDPCASIVCEVGSTCRAGQCVDDAIEPECTSDGQCGSGEVCQAGECVADGGGDECNFNSDCRDGEICQDGECARDPNVECVADRDCTGNGEVCQNNECIVPVDPVQQTCVSYCQNIFGSCPKNTCGGLTAMDRTNLDSDFDRCLNGGTAPDGSRANPCAQDYASDSQFAAQVDQFAAETCGQSEVLEDIYCFNFGLGDKCDCVEPNIGDTCNDDDDCEGGALNGVCISEIDQDTGQNTGYGGGYCISGPCDAGSQDAGAIAVGATTGCGDAGICINVNTQSGVSSICYDLCGRNSECRSGYSCEVLGFFADGTPAGKCEPSCNSNDDCPIYTLNNGGGELNSFCNADRWCETPCDPNEANSCGASGDLTCSSRPNFNTANGFTGSCSVAP